MMTGGKGAIRNRRPSGNASSRTAAWPRKRNAAAKTKHTNASVERQRRISGDGVVNQLAASRSPRASATNIPGEVEDAFRMTVLRRSEARYALMKGMRITWENASDWKAN